MKFVQFVVEIMPDHLDDPTLHEYLDSALDPARHAKAQAHLADCPACAARLAELRALFAALESLLEAPLERDLSSSVVAVLSKGQVMSGSANALYPRPVLHLIFVVQALVALILLAIALPFATQAVLWEQVALAIDVAQAADALTAFNTGLADLLNIAHSSFNETLTTLNNLPLPSLPLFSLGAVFAAVSALWLAGNVLLLTRAYQLKR